MDNFVELIKTLSPAIQALCGGLIALLGSVIIQNRNHKDDKNKFQREAIEKCYSSLILIQDMWISEKVAVQKMLKRDKHKGHYLSEAVGLSRNIEERVQDLELVINLYIPSAENCFDEFYKSHVELSVAVASAYSEKESMEADDFLGLINDLEGINHSKQYNLRLKLQNIIKSYV